MNDGNETASAPAGDGVEEARAIILRHSEKWVAEYAEREGELPDTMVFRFPFVEKLLAAVLARPRAAMGERAFQIGDRVEKVSGSSWRGKVVGAYSTTLTPEGYAVESETETGSVQIYPAKALRLALQSPPAKVEG